MPLSHESFCGLNVRLGIALPMSGHPAEAPTPDGSFAATAAVRV
jgi:hypothetical protein